MQAAYARMQPAYRRNAACIRLYAECIRHASKNQARTKPICDSLFQKKINTQKIHVEKYAQNEHVFFMENFTSAMQASIVALTMVSSV